MSATPTAEYIRPTKKQRELLAFIEDFINQHGYSPSYREVMNGLQYNSVATVALHVGNLIKRGHLRKRDHSARSLEIVQPAVAAGGAGTDGDSPVAANRPEDWLLDRVEDHLRRLAADPESHHDPAGDGRMLITALRILGLERQADLVQERLGELLGVPVAALVPVPVMSDDAE